MKMKKIEQLQVEERENAGAATKERKTGRRTWQMDVKKDEREEGSLRERLNGSTP